MHGADLIDRARGRLGSRASFELYDRTAVQRVTRLSRSGETTDLISEEGVAVRWISASGELCFGTSGGGGTAALDAAIASAEARHGLEADRWSGPEESWDQDAEPAGGDRDPSSSCRRVWSELAERGDPPVQVEASRWVTRERWWTSEGGALGRVRLRSRVYAETEADALPLVAACRGSSPRAESELLRLWDFRRWAAGASTAGSPRSILIGPEASARLVLALAHVSSLDGVEVGPAWRPVDDPSDPRALYGATFDDSGFPTRRTRLTAGGRLAAGLVGPGHFRRGSFRDYPGSRAHALRLPSTEEGLDATGDRFVAPRAVLHPGPTEWLLIAEATASPAGRAERRIVELQPREIMKRLDAAPGPSYASPLGVDTPCLSLHCGDRARVV